MKSLNRVSLGIGLWMAGSPMVVAGDHFGWRYTSTVATTAPVVHAPAASPLVYGVVQPVSTFATVPVAFVPAFPVAAPTAYVYYQTSIVPMAPEVAPMSAPSLLGFAAPAASPQAAGQSSAALPWTTAGAAGAVKARILQGLRDFAASNNLNRDTMVAALRRVGLGLLRAELNQWGLGFLVPGQADLNVLEGLVEQVVQERFGGGEGGGVAGGGTTPPSFVFQGPVTLSFPNVQSVQIQTPDVQQSGAGANGVAAGGAVDPAIPALADPNPPPASETPVPAAPTVPERE